MSVIVTIHVSYCYYSCQTLLQFMSVIASNNVSCLKGCHTIFQSLERRDFSHGLRPEHAGAGMTRAPSESSQLGAQTPSLPPTPVSPRSPTLNHNHRSPFESPSTSPTPFRRSPSPRRGMMDVGFASAVANICEQAHEIVQQEKRKHKGYFDVVAERYMSVFCYRLSLGASGVQTHSQHIDQHDCNIIMELM